MITVKEWEYVFIEWVDSMWWTGWLDKDDDEIRWIWVVKSVWIVLEQNEEYITIVQNMHSENIDNYINIPNICIKKLTRLRLWIKN